MSRSVSPSSDKPYGLFRVGRMWGASRITVRRHPPPARPQRPQRPDQVGPMPDAALLTQIRAALTRSPLHGEGHHRKVWARLRLLGVRTNKRQVLRLMRTHDLLAPSHVGAPRNPRNHDSTVVPERVDTMWGTDLTLTWMAEDQVVVFIVIDHCPAECVGIHAARRSTRFAASEPIRQGLRQRSDGFDAHVASRLSVRHDHGSQYMADTFQTELAFLGIASSPAIIRAPEGNDYAERLSRTLKDKLPWVENLDTVEDLRRAFVAFRDISNLTWLMELHWYRTPAALRALQPSRGPGHAAFKSASDKLRAAHLH